MLCVFLPQTLTRFSELLHPLTHLLNLVYVLTSMCKLQGMQLIQYLIAFYGFYCDVFLCSSNFFIMFSQFELLIHYHWFFSL
jgi:hypothetical protein